jgi:hypothetical protein
MAVGFEGSPLISVIEALIKSLIGTALTFTILLEILSALTGSRDIGLITLSERLAAFINSIADRAVWHPLYKISRGADGTAGSLSA